MTPIVDSHAYCFSAPDTPAGHPTVADHMALWQWGYARHHQPAFRVQRHVLRPTRPLLVETAPDGTVRLASDRDFRVDHDRERLVWTVDGEDFTKVFLPPNTLEYTAGNLIADMDYAGVDWALLHVDAALVEGRRVPGRLRPGIPGSTPLDGAGRRVADRERARGRHRPGARRDRGPRAPRASRSSRNTRTSSRASQVSTDRHGGRSGMR